MTDLEAALLGAVLGIVVLSGGIIVWAVVRAVADHLHDRREMSPSAQRLRQLGDTMRTMEHSGCGSCR